MKRQSVQVKVEFSGLVIVKVPISLSKKDARLLANKIACCKVLATIENEDSPDEDACESYKEQCSKVAAPQAERDWDASVIIGVGGTWSTSVVTLQQ